MTCYFPTKKQQQTNRRCVLQKFTQNSILMSIMHDIIVYFKLVLHVLVWISHTLKKKARTWECNSILTNNTSHWYCHFLQHVIIHQNHNCFKQTYYKRSCRILTLNVITLHNTSIHISQNMLRHDIKLNLWYGIIKYS